MLVMELLTWWYSQGWKRVTQDGGKRLSRISHLFSVPILIRTLWAPWRRIVAVPGSSIDQKLRALGDNLVSRAIGFTVRVLVLVTAGIMLVGAAVANLFIVVVWPLIPPAAVVLVVVGVRT